MSRLIPSRSHKQLRHGRAPHLRHMRGFTLIELVVVIMVGAIVAVFIGLFLSTPLDTYFAQSRRSDLVDSQDRILRRIAVDVRIALPGSLRQASTANTKAIEMLTTAGVARYYAQTEKSSLPPAQETLEELLVGALDSDGFYTLGTYGAAAGTYAYLAVTSPLVLSPYTLTGVMAPGPTLAFTAVPGEDQITPSAGGFNFLAAGSPTHSSFLVSGPVTYLCDTTSTVQTLRRYSGYTVVAAQVATAGQLMALGATSTLIASNVTSCTFTPFQLAGSNVGQLLILRVTLTEPTQGETLQIFHQVSTSYGT